LFIVSVLFSKPNNKRDPTDVDKVNKCQLSKALALLKLNG
jgi:hypothetical protein